MAEDFNGRDLIGDNTKGIDAYVGVDPIYQNYANSGEQPFPFHEEEITAAARAGGIKEGEQSGFEKELLDAPGYGEEDADDGNAPADSAGSSVVAPPVIPPVVES